MEVGLISQRYAKALWKYAVTHKQEAIVYSESLLMSDSYIRYPSLKRVLANRMLTNPKKVEILLVFFGAFVSNEFKRFIELVVENNREEFLQNICLSYQKIYRKNKKLLNVELTTAHAIDSETEQAILRKGEQFTGQTINFIHTVNPEIIGGYIVRWDTFRIDASTSGKLKRLHLLIGEGAN